MKELFQSDIIEKLHKLVNINNHYNGDKTGWYCLRSQDSAIKNILLTNDLSNLTLKFHNPDIIIAYHPIFYCGVPNDSEPKENRTLFTELAKRDIGVLVLHANVDVAEFGNASFLASQLKLDMKFVKSYSPSECNCSGYSPGVLGKNIGFAPLYSLNESTDIQEILSYFKESCNDSLRLFETKGKTEIKRICFQPGSGAGLVDAAASEADLIITGDMPEQLATMFIESGTNVLLLGHGNSERAWISEKLQPIISEAFPEINVESDTTAISFKLWKI